MIRVCIEPISFCVPTCSLNLQTMMLDIFHAATSYVAGIY